MYSRLIQGYENMDPEAKDASASAARQLRLMVIFGFKPLTSQLTTLIS